MVYNYHIIEDVYQWMKSKEKKVEVRILKEKSSKIQVGDTIIFENQDQEGKYIKAKVIQKEIVNSKEELLEKYDVNLIMPNHSEKELLELLESIYKEELKEKPLVAFTLEYFN